MEYCVLCNSDRYNVIFKKLIKSTTNAHFITQARFHSHGELVRCSECGLIYSKSTSFLKKNYYEEMVDDEYLKEEKCRIKSWNHLWKTLKRNKISTGKLLDIGTGPGFFLHQTKSKGWEAHGVEPSHWGKRIIGNRDSSIKLYSDIMDIQGTSLYELVTMMDVIEHLPEPHKVLLKVRDLIKDRGVLYITAPDMNSIAARLLGNYWWNVIPSHIFYFTPKTITRLLNNSGFSVMKIRRFKRCLPLSSWLNRFFQYTSIKITLPVINFPVYLNLGDHMEVYANANTNS